MIIMSKLKVFMRVETKADYDWFVKLYPDTYKYRWEDFQRRGEPMCMCWDGDIGQNPDNGYLESHGFERITRPKFKDYYEQICGYYL